MICEEKEGNSAGYLSMREINIGDELGKLYREEIK